MHKAWNTTQQQLTQTHNPHHLATPVLWRNVGDGADAQTLPCNKCTRAPSSLTQPLVQGLIMLACNLTEYRTVLPQ
ncbi:MAG: hypothetical protein ACKPKO_17545, partial [Candidatus Fonsibacter sp.]